MCQQLALPYGAQHSHFPQRQHGRRTLAGTPRPPTPSCHPSQAASVAHHHALLPVWWLHTLPSPAP